MSLPTSEPLPTHINDLPPARQRHIRRHPQGASPAERQILLESLLEMVRPSLSFFLFSFLGSLVFGFSLYLNEPAVLLIGLVIMPLLSPIFSLSLFPHTHKFNHWIKSLVSLLIPVLFSFIAGVIAGYLQKNGQVNRLDAIRLSAPYWLDLIAVAFSAFMCVLILVQHGKLPGKIGVLLSYEILFPVAIAGFGFPIGLSRIWPNALLMALCHLLLAIFVSIMAFLIFGFRPRQFTGWILTTLALILTLALFTGTFLLNDLDIPFISNSPPTSTPIAIATNTKTSKPSSTKQAEITNTKTAMQTAQKPTSTITPTFSPTVAELPTGTPSPQPTSFSIIINSINGLVIRTSADFQAEVIGYANDGDQFEVLNQSISSNGSLWYLVETSSGEKGWLLSSLVNTQTPTP